MRLCSMVSSLAHLPFCRQKYDAFLVVHGTDTMAYTASALSLMLLGFRKPIVMTGQLPAQQHTLHAPHLWHSKHTCSAPSAAECCLCCGAISSAAALASQQWCPDVLCNHSLTEPHAQ